MSSDLPLISVVLCTYNGERYVAEQLDSILVQTYRNLEILICDDASTDGTVAILQRYALRDSRINVRVNRENVGYNKNFENALQLARADWLAVSDQDDIWLPHKLASLYRCATDDTLLVHSYSAEFRNDDAAAAVINRSRVRFQGNKTRELLFYNTVSGHTMLFHKSLLAASLPFPDGVYYDWWLGVNASLRSCVQLHPEALVLHRQHSSNASQITANKNKAERKKCFFEARIHTLQQFARLPALPANDKRLLAKYILLLQRRWKKRFSVSVFLFFLRYARSAFYFRKKKPMLFYYFKYSLQRADLKVDHWT